MTTYENLIDEVGSLLSGFGLVQPRITHLTAGLGLTSTTFSVASTDGLEQGVVEVGPELMLIESVDRMAATVTLAPYGRGYMGSPAYSHASGVTVTMAPPFPRVRIERAINDTIIGTWPTLWGRAQHTFTFNPSQTTYSLPSTADTVLSVTADVNGPSREQQVITRYSVSMTAPTDDWPTGKSITLQQGVTPGRTVTVTHRTRPVELAGAAQDFTECGLGNTARQLVIFGACAHLVQFLDISRLSVDTAEANEYAERNQLGMASRISTQLEARYERELERERQRLRESVPPIVHRRYR